MDATSGWIRSLWCDESGFVLSTELTLMGSVLAVGTIVGLASLRDTVTAELSDLAHSLSGLDQSYSYSGLQGCSAQTAGSHVPSSGAEQNAELEADLAPQSCINIEGSSSKEAGTMPDLPLSI